MPGTLRTNGTAKRARHQRAVVPSSRARTLTVPRGVRTRVPKTGFPKQMTMRHHYNTPPFAFNSSGLVQPNTQQWRVNGMFDPDFSGIGHQPLYFDQVTPIYNHYTVLESEIIVKVTVISDGSEPTESPYAAFGLYLEDDTSVNPNTYAGMAEQPSAVTSTARFNGEPHVIRKKWNARQAFGGNTMDNAQLRGTGAANPTEEQFFTFFFTTEPAKTVKIMVEADIIYTAVWTEIKPQTIS